MRFVTFGFVSVAALGLSAVSAGAMPIGMAAPIGPHLPVAKVAGGCGAGLVRGRRGTCLRRPAVFSHSGRIVRPGCGKPIGAGLRTPC